MSGADQPGGRGDDAALAAEHVLGLLAPDEARAFEARLAVDAPARALVARWTEDLAALADAVPAVAPRPEVEAALMRRLFPEPPRRGLLGRLGLLPLGLGAAAAALVIVLVSTLGPGPGAPDLVATIAAEDGSLVVRAGYDAGAGVLRVERVAGVAAPDRDQELWLIAGEAAPASLGVLPDEGPATVPVPAALRPGLAGGTLAVSDEAPGGSATGSPGTVLAVGALTET